VPERASLVYPEYLDADTPDEIVKAVRKNILYGAKVIKIMVDAKSYGYTVDEMKLFVSEAAKSGLKVAGHVQTRAGALRAIEAGIWSIEHSGALDDEAHKLMAKKGIWRVGTETPISEYFQPNQARFNRTVEGVKNAWANGVKMAFSTDADYYIPGMTRGQVVIDFLKTWKAAGLPAREILKIMTVNGYRVRHRGQTRPGESRDGGGPDRRVRESAGGHRRAAQRAVRDEGRHSLQARRCDDTGEVLPQRSGKRVADSLAGHESERTVAPRVSG
jgi:imidazolonepropionase-like amidohydrolase